MTPSGTRQRRVLIVEDFDDLRHLLVTGLRRAGYHVDGAASLAQALALAPEGYDVLVSDLSLGDAFGTELLDQVRARNTDCRCLLMTGGGLGPEPPAGVPVLVKPFRIDALVAAVRGLLAADTDAP